MDFGTRWEALSQGIVPLQVTVEFQKSSVPIMPYPGWAVEVHPVEQPEHYYFWDDLELKVTPEGVVRGIMHTWVLDGKYLTFDKNIKFAFEQQEGEPVYVPLIIYLARPAPRHKRTEAEWRALYCKNTREFAQELKRVLAETRETPEEHFEAMVQAGIIDRDGQVLGGDGQVLGADELPETPQALFDSMVRTGIIDRDGQVIRGDSDEVVDSSAKTETMTSKELDNFIRYLGADKPIFARFSSEVLYPLSALAFRLAIVGLLDHVCENGTPGFRISNRGRLVQSALKEFRVWHGEDLYAERS